MKKILQAILIALVLISIESSAQQLSIKLPNTTYKQDFDTLGSSTSTAYSYLPYGWYLFENGSSSVAADQKYSADLGTSNAGNMYSYGTSSGSTDRALGSIGSGSNQPVYGVLIQNNTGQTITSFRVKFDIEQYRYGGGRTVLDSSPAEISFGNTNLTSQSTIWTKVPKLSLKSQNITPTAATSLDGNSNANRLSIDYTITGVSVANGGTMFIRWNDINIAGNDDGLALDNFEITAIGNLPSVVSFARTSINSIEQVDSIELSINVKPKGNVLSFNIVDANNGNAFAGIDYVKPIKVITTKATDSVVKFYVKLLNDTKVDGTRVFRLKLNGITGTNVIGTDSIITITILDDDVYPNYKIVDAKFPLTAGKSDTLKYGFFKGIVNSNNLNQLDLTATIQDNTGGIGLKLPTLPSYTANITSADSIIVRGTVRNRGFQTYILVDSFKILTKASIPNALIVQRAFNDSLESQLIKLNNLQIATGFKWDTTGARAKGGFFLNVRQYTTGLTFSIFIASNTSLFAQPPVRDYFNLTGIVLQGGNTATSGYYLAPRAATDIQLITLPLSLISSVLPNDANGVNVLSKTSYRTRLRGTVYSPSFNTTSLQFAISDGTGGIYVFAPNVKNYTPVLGDSIEVRGFITQFNGLTEINADSIRSIGTQLLRKPKPAKKVTEIQENEFVRINNVYLVDPTKWSTGTSSFNVDITNGTDTTVLRVTNAVNVIGSPAPTGRFDVQGIGTQFDNSNPFTSGYQLLVRYRTDIFPILARRLNITQIINQNLGTGAIDSTNVRGFIEGYVTGTVLSESDTVRRFSITNDTAAITIQTTSLTVPTLSQKVRVYGYSAQYNGLTVFRADSTKTNIGTKSPVTVIVTDVTETSESKYVTVRNINFSSALTDTAGKKVLIGTPIGKNYEIHFLRGTVLFKTYLPLLSNTSYDISGIVQQYDISNPFTSGYYIVPQIATDVSVRTGIITAKVLTKISVYPNPATSQILVSADSKIETFRLFSLDGRVALNNLNVNSNTVAVDVSALSAGVYTVYVTTTNGAAIQKIVKQ